MKKNLFFAAPLFLLAAVLAVSCINRTESDLDYDFKFAFLTDIHVEYGKNADKGFQAAIDHVNALQPDFIITGGDLIADALGQSEEKATELYDLYVTMMEGFNAPLYNTLGNHEEFGIYEKSGVQRDHPLYGDKMFEQRIGERFYAFDYKGWRFYILDSVDETDERQYFGHIDSAQRVWLMEDLKNVDPKTPLVISSHIPFITAYAQTREGSLAQNSPGLVVGNSKEVLEIFSGHNLKMVLQGHLHILEEIYIDDIRFLIGGAVSGHWWNGPHEGTEEGYLLLKVRGEEIDWEYIDYGWQAGNRE